MMSEHLFKGIKPFPLKHEFALELNESEKALVPVFNAACNAYNCDMDVTILDQTGQPLHGHEAIAITLSSNVPASLFIIRGVDERLWIDSHFAEALEFVRLAHVEKMKRR